MKSDSDKYGVVIVEDEGLIAEDLRVRLTAAGYFVAGIADSSPEAMRVIRATRPDVVLMDIRIKGNEDGIEVARKVREECDIPVIYLTAYEDRATLARASETAPYGYIKKPIAGASLQGSIEMAIAKHRDDRYVSEQRDWALANFAAAPHALLVTDRSGRVSWLNPLAEELLGWTAEKALGRPCAGLLHLFYSVSGEPVEDLVSTVVELGETVALPPDILLDTGSERLRPVAGAISPTWRGNRVEGTVIALDDVSVSRLEEADVRMGSTYDAVRRLVNGIVGRLPDAKTAEASWDAMQLLLDTVPEPGPLHERLEVIQHKVMDSFALGTSLSALLVLPEVHLQRILLNETLRSVQVILQGIAPGLAVSAPDIPMPVQADARQLTAALVSIVLYAHRHAAAGGGMAIDVSHPETKQMRHWTRLRLTYPCADEGRNAPELAFEPDCSDPAQDLHAAYGIIRNMGGLLVAQPGRNKTGVFEIYLRQAKIAVAGQELPEDADGVEAVAT